MAYAPRVSLFDRLRNLLSGPPRVADGGDPEAAAALHEEYGTPDAGEADLERMAETGGGPTYAAGGYARDAGFGASEAAEAAEDDLESEAAPPDPAP